MRAHHAHHRGFHGVVMPSPPFLDRVRAQVGRHDDDRVAEIHRAALAVGQATVIQHLQEDIEHVRMGFSTSSSSSSE